MSKRWKTKAILSKIETSYGVDPTPTGASNGILMTNVSWTPMDGEDVSRDLELPYLAAQGKIPVGLRTRLQGKVELVGSGTAGVAPAWGPLLRACGCAETIVADTSVTYTPITDEQESLATYFQIDGTKQVILGQRATVVMRWAAQKIPYLEFDLIGLYGDPEEAAMPTVDLTNFQKPAVVTKARVPTFTLDDGGGAVTMKLRELALTLGNDVQPRLLANSEEILIVDRNESIRAQVEAVALTSFDPFALAKAQTPVEISLVHGTVAGTITTLSVPIAQVGRPTNVENQQNIAEWPLDLTPLPDSGNDQWSLVLT